jgi:hypothetical protein
LFYANCPWYVYQSRLFVPVNLTSLQIFFAVRAIQEPSSIPISLASLHLMQQASDDFMGHISMLLSETGNFSDQLLSLRKLFESGNIPNKITDGTTPFPENQQLIGDGISLEFRYFVCRPQFLQGVHVNKITGMCRSNILEMRSMLYAISLLELYGASFV